MRIYSFRKNGRRITRGGIVGQKGKGKFTVGGEGKGIFQQLKRLCFWDIHSWGRMRGRITVGEEG